MPPAKNFLLCDTSWSGELAGRRAPAMASTPCHLQPRLIASSRHGADTSRSELAELIGYVSGTLTRPSRALPSPLKSTFIHTPSPAWRIRCSWETQQGSSRQSEWSMGIGCVAGYTNIMPSGYAYGYTLAHRSASGTNGAKGSRSLRGRGSRIIRSVPSSLSPPARFAEAETQTRRK